VFEKPYDDSPNVGDGIPVNKEEVEFSEIANSETGHPASQERRYRPKKKVPIVNRRGPSELDRLIKMSKNNNQKTAQPGRKMLEGSTGRGTIIRIDRAKGFGFLIDQMGEQRFFHRSAVLDNGFSTLAEQQAVEFQAHNDARGARALKVRPSNASDRFSKSPARTQRTANPDKVSTWRSALSPFRNGTTTPSNPGIFRSKNRNRNR
jgi:cold shock CspA family protein